MYSTINSTINCFLFHLSPLTIYSKGTSPFQIWFTHSLHSLTHTATTILTWASQEGSPGSQPLNLLTLSSRGNHLRRVNSPIYWVDRKLLSNGIVCGSIALESYKQPLMVKSISFHISSSFVYKLTTLKILNQGFIKRFDFCRNLQAHTHTNTYRSEYIYIQITFLPPIPELVLPRIRSCLETTIKRA